MPLTGPWTGTRWLTVLVDRWSGGDAALSIVLHSGDTGDPVCAVCVWYAPSLWRRKARVESVMENALSAEAASWRRLASSGCGQNAVVEGRAAAPFAAW